MDKEKSLAIIVICNKKNIEKVKQCMGSIDKLQAIKEKIIVFNDNEDIDWLKDYKKWTDKHIKTTSNKKLFDLAIEDIKSEYFCFIGKPMMENHLSTIMEILRSGKNAFELVYCGFTIQKTDK